MSRPNVLFVDDEPRVLDALRRDFHGRRKDWDMRFARDGREALGLLDACPADVVVTDIAMPQMDGEDLIRALHENRSPTPVIILSGHWNQSIAFGKVGPNVTFLAKPASRELLDWTIGKVIRDHRRAVEVAAPPPAGRPTIEFVPAHDAGLDGMGWVRLVEKKT